MHQNSSPQKHYYKNLIFFLLLFFPFLTTKIYSADIKQNRDNSSHCEEQLSSSSKTPLQLSSQKWTPTFDTIEGRIELLMSMLERHPNFVNQNLNYRRNLMETFSYIPTIIENLKENTAELEIVPPQVFSVRYTEKPITYNAQLFEEFHRSCVEDLKNLSLNHSGNLITQIRTLGTNKKKLKSLFQLLPFLFNSDGTAKFDEWNENTKNQIAKKIKSLSPIDLKKLYFELFPNSFDEQIKLITNEKGLGGIQIIYNSIKNNFIQKKIKNLIRPIGLDNKNEKVRTISLESIPASVAVARGCFGGDCSMLSVAFFSLLKDVKVHFIRKSKDLTTAPKGYVLSVDVEIDSKTNNKNKKVPYVLTVNGATLTESDIRVAIDLMLKSNPNYSVDDQTLPLIIFPNLNINHNLINSENARMAMKHKNGKTVKVTFPKGWDALDRFHIQNNQIDFHNYYHQKLINTAFLDEFDPRVYYVGEIENQTHIKPNYVRPKKIDSNSKIERSIIASQALLEQEPTEQSIVNRQEIIKALALEESDVDAVMPLVNASPTQGISLHQYRRLESKFGSILKEILAFKIKTRAKILSTLYEESPELFSEHNARQNSKIIDTLITYYGGDLHQDIICKIFKSENLSDSQLFELLFTTSKVLGSTKLSPYIKLNDLILKRNFSSEFSELASQSLLASIYSNAGLARLLSQALSSKNETTRSFGETVVNQGLQLIDWQKRFPILASYRDILVIRHTNKSYTFHQASKEWLNNPKIDVTTKSEFIMNQIGSGNMRFERLIDSLPEALQIAVWREIANKTCIPVFLKTAKKNKLNSLLFDSGILESFQFKSIITDEEVKNGGVKFMMGNDDHIHEVTLSKSFQIAVTPFTQLTAALATGKNQSKDVDNGFEIIINKHKVKIDPNRPAEQYSWEDMQIILDYLNANDSNWHYRRPTKAEWEYAMRGGARSEFSFDKEKNNISSYAWISENSKNRTQHVARLLPNAYGLYDMHGNVWEWVQDEHEASKNSIGTYRVRMGGSYFLEANELQSSSQSYAGSDYESEDVGMRFVRTAK